MRMPSRKREQKNAPEQDHRREPKKPPREDPPEDWKDSIAQLRAALMERSLKEAREKVQAEVDAVAEMMYGPAKKTE